MHNLKVENYVSCGGCTEDLGLPWWLRGKESTCQAGDMGLIPGSGKSPREGNGNPLQYSCLGNPMDKESGGLQSMGSPEVQYNLVTKKQ